MSDRPKLEDVLALALENLNQGKFFYSSHANLRLNERRITRRDIQHVIRNGWREKRKDEWDLDRNSWKYSIRGKDIDELRQLRIAVAIDNNGTILVTAIDLSTKN